MTCIPTTQLSTTSMSIGAIWCFSQAIHIQTQLYHEPGHSPLFVLPLFRCHMLINSCLARSPFGNPVLGKATNTKMKLSIHFPSISGSRFKTNVYFKKKRSEIGPLGARSRGSGCFSRTVSNTTGIITPKVEITNLPNANDVLSSPKQRQPGFCTSAPPHPTSFHPCVRTRCTLLAFEIIREWTKLIGWIYMLVLLPLLPLNAKSSEGDGCKWHPHF